MKQPTRAGDDEMTNEEMTPNRFARKMKARNLYRKIINTFNAGGIVTVATMTHATHYQAKHASMFRLGATEMDVYAQHGKHWLCITPCAFRFSTPKGW